MFGTFHAPGDHSVNPGSSPVELCCNLSQEILMSTCGMESELAALIGSRPGSLSVALVALQLKPRRITARKPKATPRALTRLIRSPNTNRPASANSPSTLVLLDLLNENFGERGSGWNDVLNALQNAESGRRVYVYLLTPEGALYPVRALPDAEHPGLPDDDGWVAQLQTLLDEAMHAVNPTRRRELQSDVDARVQATLGAVRDLASDFASQPGRKCLVWISRGVPIGARGADLHWHDFTLSVMRLGTDLARSGIAVYAVDQQTDHATPSSTGMDTLDQLASLTAGLWFPSSATAEAIRQAMSEGRATYQVAYRPPLDRWGNKFHKLEVTAEGQAGIPLRVRTIDGYYGYAREADPRDGFAPAAVGPSDVSAIGIRATAAPSRKGNGWIHFEIRVDAADLRMTQGATYTGRFLMAFAYYAAGWQLDLTEELPTDLQLTTEEHDAIMRDGVRLSLDRPLRAGASKMRIVVRDPESGALGSLTVPVAAKPQ